jgi:3-hydroxyisobutyrate dehydrogenase-like beta-hydroxyacid dehydrogenase
MARLGFVGLGVMGGRIAKRLLDAGHTVTGYNRTKSKAQWLVDAGMTLLDSPREVAESAEIVFTMVTDTTALERVALGPDGVLAGLRPGGVYVDMSTVSPARSRELAAQVAEAGAFMLDVPVSGSVETLERGDLALMIGGDKDVFERILPVLADIGPRQTYVGGNGKAVLMKIAINLNLMVQMTAFSEGVLLAEKGGIPREAAVEAMLAGVVASPMVRYRGPFVLEGHLPTPAWFDCNMMQKDMLLALEQGRELDVPMPTTAVTNELLTACRGEGLDHQDFAVVFQLLARHAGLLRRPEKGDTGTDTTGAGEAREPVGQATGGSRD